MNKRFSEARFSEARLILTTETGAPALLRKGLHFCRAHNPVAQRTGNVFFLTKQVNLSIPALKK